MSHVNSNLNKCLSKLGMTESEFALFINVDLNDLLKVGQVDPDDFEGKLSLKEVGADEMVEDCVSFIDSALHSFSFYAMPKDVILSSLTHKFETDHGSLSLIDISKIRDFSVRHGLFFKKVEEINYAFFSEENIGSRASRSKILNKEIAEQIFGYPVAVKSKDVYTEHGGDYEVPEVQVRTTIFSDGSGEWWVALEKYSTDISAAWKVVNKVAEMGGQIRLSNKAQGNEYWWCYIDGEATQGSTVMEAICEAALKWAKTKKD